MNLFGNTITVSRRTIILMGLLAVLTPLAYLLGRYFQPLAAPGWPATAINATWIIALGSLLGIPIGLFFGSIRGGAYAGEITSPDQSSVIQQLKAELVENQQLFMARKGSTSLVARLSYVTSFWETAKSSRLLTGFNNPRALSEIGLAYYWLNQANHLEALAYDAKNGGVARDPEFTTAKLISEIRLLDEAIEKALTAALGAIADLTA